MNGSKYNGYQDFSQVDFEWAVKLNRITLNLIGLWPTSGQSSRQKLICNIRVLIIFLGVTFVVIVPSLHSLIRIRGHDALVLDNLQYILPLVSSSVRIVLFWWKKEAIVPVMNMIAQDWTKPRSAQEKCTMIRWAQNTHIIISSLYCVVGAGFFFVIGLPCFGVFMRLTSNITDPGRPMPIQSYYIYDVTKSPQYELTFASQAVYVGLGMICYTAIDNFLGMLVFHICGQLNILTNRLTHLHEFINYRDTLRECVIEHIRLLRAIAAIEDMYNVTLLALFAYFAMHFALYGFRLISLFDEKNNSFFHILYVICIMSAIFIHMYLYCGLGEILLTQCNKMYYAAYNNNWYSMDPKVAKNLLPLLTRGAKPVYLTAGKIFPMTMATFCSFLKTSAGYVSVLHSTRS